MGCLHLSCHALSNHVTHRFGHFRCQQLATEYSDMCVTWLLSAWQHAAAHIASCSHPPTCALLRCCCVAGFFTGRKKESMFAVRHLAMLGVAPSHLRIIVCTAYCVHAQHTRVAVHMQGGHCLETVQLVAVMYCFVC